jgi:hypothetical protein
MRQLSTHSTLKVGSSTHHPPVRIESVEAIFSTLHAQFGTKFADFFAGVDPHRVKSEWREALGVFHSSELTRGLAACRTRSFVPSLGDFLRLCRPALDPETAWIEASEGMRQRIRGRSVDWSHPAVYRAACSMAFELRESGFKEHRRIWAWRLNIEFEKGWGEDVPLAPTSLLSHTSVPTRKATAAEREKLAQLCAQMKAPRVRL